MLYIEDDEELVPCGMCGGTETVELHLCDEKTGFEMSVTVCADCGSDE